MRALFFICLFSIGLPQASATDFPGTFPKPPQHQLNEPLILWSTHYRVHAAKNTADGIPLRDKNEVPLGPKLDRRNFCEAAMQGTVTVEGSGGVNTYNTYNAGRIQYTNCLPFYRRAIRLGRISRRTVKALGRARFFKTDADFGLGVRNWHLRPLRTIAVDKSQTPIPYKSVVYIPQADGKSVTLPDGSKVVHDGYFLAADTGSNIKKNHIDVFAGVSTSNPFPDFIRSVEEGTFKAYVVDMPEVSTFLKSIHKVR